MDIYTYQQASYTALYLARFLNGATNNTIVNILKQCLI